MDTQSSFDQYSVKGSQGYLGPHQVVEARLRFADGERIRDLADTFHVPYDVMRKAIVGFTHKHLPHIQSPPGRPKGERNPNVKLSDADVVAIYEQFQADAKGVTERSIADKYGVSKTLIHAIRHGHRVPRAIQDRYAIEESPRTGETLETAAIRLREPLPQW